MSNVLLLGCGGAAGINFTKSLHMRGHKVIGMDLNKYYLDSCNANIKLNRSENILEIIDKYNIDLVHAQPDVEVEYLLSKPELKNYIFPHSLDIWKKFNDKLYCQKKWRNIKNFFTCSFKEAYEYPVLFSEMLYKGSGKVWIRCLKGAGSKAALPITTMEQGLNWASYWREMKGIKETDFMLCQFLPGREFAVQTFWYHGKLIHAQARERLIYFFGALMPSGQTSTPAVAKAVMYNKPYQIAERAIKEIDKKPHGIYCVDMKEDMEGDCIPTEVNYGRFFTTNDFFSTLGVNTPDEYVRSTQPGYKPDILINSIPSDYYWIRGLDREPKLIKYE